MNNHERKCWTCGNVAIHAMEHHGLTLARLAEVVDPKYPFLIALKDHYVVLYRRQIVCTSTKGSLQPVYQNRYRQDRVQRAWKICGTLNTKDAKNIIVDARKASTLSAKEVSARTKFNRLVKKYRLVIDRDYEYGSGRLQTIWMHWPENSEIFGLVDSWEDNHTAFDYEEAVGRIEETVRDAKEILADIASDAESHLELVPVECQQSFVGEN